jgi:predicted methyltransferase
MRRENLSIESCLAALLLLLAASCGAPSAGGTEETAMTPIAAALAAKDRPAADREDDALRKPAEVLAFAGIEPGMTVFEMEAGQGYYTEIISRVVGPDGSVVMQNPAIFDAFAGAAVTRRLAGNRLPNVRHVKCDFDELKAEDATVDIVTWFLGPHELYFTPAGVDSLGDVEGSYAEAFRVLKPGGYFVILDHAAAPGTPETSGGSTHRIDPAIVKDLVAAAGFEFVEESDILRNPDDQYELGVFNPEVRRRTDRFLLKYRKPA